MSKIPKTMVGAYLPGDSTVKFKKYAIPELGHGEVLIKTKACTICGSDIRCIYHEHLGKGPEGYQKEMVAGHDMVLSLMASAFVASGIARWMTPPMYVELAAMFAPARRPGGAS